MEVKDKGKCAHRRRGREQNLVAAAWGVVEIT